MEDCLHTRRRCLEEKFMHTSNFPAKIFILQFYEQLLDFVVEFDISLEEGVDSFLPLDLYPQPQSQTIRKI